jgi:hypothetical protein
VVDVIKYYAGKRMVRCWKPIPALGFNSPDPLHTFLKIVFVLLKLQEPPAGGKNIN